MADFKRVILKDPVSGENLMPVVPDILQYEIVEGQEVAPFEFEASPSDASTLEGHPASYFATAAEAAELKTSVSEGKALIAAAVTDKGVQTAADDTFTDMAANIAAIATGHKIITNGITANASSGMTLTLSPPADIAASDIAFIAASGRVTAGGTVMLWSCCGSSSSNFSTVMTTFNGTTGTNQAISSRVGSAFPKISLLVDNANGSGVLSLSNLTIYHQIIVLK